MRYLLLFLFTLPAMAQLPFSGLHMVAASYTNNASGGGGGGVDITEDFGGDLSTWTQAAGTWSIISGQLQLESLSTDSAIIHNTALNTANGYCKIVFEVAGYYSSIAFRYTDASSPFYALEFDLTTSDDVVWKRYSALGSSVDVSAATDVGAIGDGTSMGVTWTGTGTSTTIRIWNVVTADDPTAIDTWDGGAPDVTLTDDPASAVDTGAKVGLLQWAPSNIARWDTFRAGDK